MREAKIKANWGTGDVRIIVGRNVNGITLNSYEYIMDDNNFLIGFSTEKSARDCLHRHGISDMDIEYLEFFYRTECPNCGEEVIVKTYDAKKENGFKTISCNNCKTKINFETEEKKMNENEKNVKFLTEQDVIDLSNTQKREAFLASYKEWGVWLDVEPLGLKVYKALLPNGRIIYVTEYPARDGRFSGYVHVDYRYAADNGRYESFEDGRSKVADRLKDLKVKIVQERRRENA